MNSEVIKDLSSKTQADSQAYVRNLIIAERAILAGQFNAAKVLRAAAHSQRVLAMNAARLLTSDPDMEKAFEVNIHELDIGKAELSSSSILPDSQNEIQASLEQIKVVESKLKEILNHALTSLRDNSDVLESDVGQIIWGCHGCGYLIEGDLPDACPVCGALSIEFEWFGPFYFNTPEHLGQRTPIQIVSILEKIPAQIEELIEGVDDGLLTKKPSEEEWCVKEIVGHIIEVEVLFFKRVHTLMAHQGIPEFSSTAPPWTLHEGKGYENWLVSELISRLKETRSATIHLLNSLKDDDWARVGTNEGSPVSLLDLGTWLTNHDVGHVAQIKRYIPDSA